MSETIKTNGHSGAAAVSTARLEALARSLTECVDELDALGKFCEANHVALARDLVLRGSATHSMPEPEQLG